MYEFVTIVCVQIQEFRNAIEADYFFEMFIDDLPMWGYLGEVRELVGIECVI
jgi:hypothetical protein